MNDEAKVPRPIIKAIFKPGRTWFPTRRSRVVIDQDISLQWFTAEEVFAWLEESAISKSGKRRAPIPDREQCEKAAERLSFMLDRSPMQYQPPLDGIEEIRAATKALRTKREWHEERLAGRVRTDLENEVCNALLAAEQANQKVLDLHDDIPTLRCTWHDEARMIADLAMRAWAAAGIAPTSNKEEGPLCEFVHLALNELFRRRASNTKVKPERKSMRTIESALRGERGTSKKRRNLVHI
ncbi:hypothetical+protein [Methylocapsa aurea]|uniref:hypothetical protein n=1 Tax=Methylocapsa aurea TaxID=663610 RepID=UPI003D18DA3B